MEKVVHVEVLDGYTLDLWFDTGDQRRFDATPYLARGVFTALKNRDLFRQAFVACGTVCWPGDLDIAPETLFDRSTPIDAKHRIAG